MPAVHLDRSEHMMFRLLKRRIAVATNNRGEMYIDTIISVFVILVVLALVMALLPVFMKKYNLDMMANEISRFIAVSGSTSSFNIDELEEDYGIELDSWNIEIAADARTAPSPDGGTKIQLADAFTVTIVMRQNIGVGGIVGDINIPITAVAKGRSEVYWKELAVE